MTTTPRDASGAVRSQHEHVNALGRLVAVLDPGRHDLHDRDSMTHLVPADLDLRR